MTIKIKWTKISLVLLMFFVVYSLCGCHLGADRYYQVGMNGEIVVSRWEDTYYNSNYDTHGSEDDSTDEQHAVSNRIRSDSSQTSTTTAEMETEEVNFSSISNKVLHLNSGLNMNLLSSDVSEYPTVKLYCDIVDRNGSSVVLTSPTAGITEIISGGTQIERQIKSIERLDGNVGVGFDLIMDKSESMMYDFANMQLILGQFIENMDYHAGDHAEIIAFDSYIMYMCNYTNDKQRLLNGIQNMSPYGATALYDALMTGVTNASRRTGANCVIAFTDGMDNQSNASQQDVINAATASKVPVYIIGMGDVDESVLRSICQATGGNYWNIQTISDMRTVLNTIYQTQKDLYCITYESDTNADAYAQREVSVAVADDRYGASLSNVVFTPNAKMGVSTHTSRYEIIQADISWSEANAECLRRGGHLVTITSQEEMDAMSRMAEEANLKYVWIGGYTSVRDGAVYGHWTTGEPFEYQMWYPNEPSRNDLDGTPEFYLMLWKAGGFWSWNDQRDDVIRDSGLSYFIGTTGYICEYEN